MALSVGVGLGVLTELMDEEVEQVVGPKGRHDPERTAHRHGQEGGEVTLGGRRVAVKRSRVRSADGQSEVALSTYAHFADCDPLSRVVLERMLAGTSTRRYPRTQEPVGEEVEQATEALLSSDGWRGWLRTRAALHRYSANNTLLIWGQALERGFEPTYVAGFKAWLGLGRCVRKGETGLKVFAPMPVRNRDSDDQEKTPARAGGAKKDGETEPRRMRFRLSSVFDTLSRARAVGLSSGAVGRLEALSGGRTPLFVQPPRCG